MTPCNTQPSIRPFYRGLPRRLARVSAAFLVLAACGSTQSDTLTLPAAPTVTLPMGTDVVLAPGEYVVVNPGGLRLTFAGVTGESRCPVNVLIQCIQAGSARIALRVTSSAGTRDVALETTARGDTTTVERYAVRLVGVTPVPTTTDPIPAASYRTTLRVTVK